MLESLQNLPVFVAITESGSIWAYPTILVLHTAGLALIVGSAVVVNARVLGLGARAPLTAFGRLFPVMWIGFAINAISGFILFAIAATSKAAQGIFWLKLALVLFALLLTYLLSTVVRRGDVYSGRILAVLSLLAWTGAIVAGRLMAYVKW